MNFKTSINLSEIIVPQTKINYQSRVLLTGSCFVENIGNKLFDLKFNVLINPFGVLFHPLAIEKSLRDIVYQKIYQKQDLIFDQGIWHSLYHHSHFSNENQDAVIKAINTKIQNAFNFLQNTTHVIITLGTAWVYHHIPSDNLVSNCHKIHPNQFIKRILTVQEIENALDNIGKLIHQINPKIIIVYTLSPIRHLKDGMQNNTLSKARLLHAIHNVINQESKFYFPAFEIILDDLRDYRFYASDMLHPSEVAVEYVWEIFEKTYLTDNAQKDVKEVQQILKDLAHIPFHPNSETHLQFLNKLEQKKKAVWERLGF